MTCPCDPSRILRRIPGEDAADYFARCRRAGARLVLADLSDADWRELEPPRVMLDVVALQERRIEPPRHVAKASKRRRA